MSKAFTRESDDAPERPLVRRPPASAALGEKNYLTPDGARRFQVELDRLVEAERPQAAALTDPTESRQKLQELDRRIQQLQEILRTAVVRLPPADPEDRIRFGATVTVRGRGGEESRYRLVGVDETDLDRNWVSWRSPLAKALLNARKGDRVHLRLPSGEEQLEIVAVAYE
jgi:transcription elongation factor GreB